jgi:hypothetical protein
MRKPRFRLKAPRQRHCKPRMPSCAGRSPFPGRLEGRSLQQCEVTSQRCQRKGLLPHASRAVGGFLGIEVLSRLSAVNWLIDKATRKTSGSCPPAARFTVAQDAPSDRFGGSNERIRIDGAEKWLRKRIPVVHRSSSPLNPLLVSIERSFRSLLLVH